MRFVSSFSSLWSEKMLDMISIFLNLLSLVCVLSCGLSLKMLHVHLKRMCILLLWDERFYMSVNSILSRTLYNTAISLLIFCLANVSIFVRGLLKSPSIIVLLSISFLKSSKIFFMYLGALCLVHIYVQCLCLFDGFSP